MPPVGPGAPLPFVPPALALDFGDLLSRWGIEAAAEALANLPQGFFQDPFFASNHDALASLVIRGYVTSCRADDGAAGWMGRRFMTPIFFKYRYLIGAHCPSFPRPPLPGSFCYFRRLSLSPLYRPQGEAFFRAEAAKFGVPLLDVAFFWALKPLLAALLTLRAGAGQGGPMPSQPFAAPQGGAAFSPLAPSVPTPPHGGGFPPVGPPASPGAAWGMDPLLFPLPVPPQQTELPSSDGVEDPYSSMLFPHLGELPAEDDGEDIEALMGSLLPVEARGGNSGVEGPPPTAGGWDDPGDVAPSFDEWGSGVEVVSGLGDYDAFPLLGPTGKRGKARPEAARSAWGTTVRDAATRRSPAAEAAALAAEEDRILQEAIAASLAETGPPSRSRLFSEGATSSALVPVGSASEGFGLANATGEYNCFLNVIIQVGETHACCMIDEA